MNPRTRFSAGQGTRNQTPMERLRSGGNVLPATQTDVLYGGGNYGQAPSGAGVVGEVLGMPETAISNVVRAVSAAQRQQPYQLDPNSEYGDIFRDVGAPEPVAATLGFGASLLEPTPGGAELAAVGNALAGIGTLKGLDIFQETSRKAIEAIKSGLPDEIANWVNKGVLKQDELPLIEENVIGLTDVTRESVATARNLIEDNAAAVADNLAQGGFTLDMAAGRTIPLGKEGRGFAVAIYPSIAQSFSDFDNLDVADTLSSYLFKNLPIFNVPGHNIGGWVDDTGILYLEPSIVVPRSKIAQELGEKYNQMAYVNLRTGEFIDLPGNTGQSIWTPPEGLSGYELYKWNLNRAQESLQQDILPRFGGELPRARYKLPKGQ